ncbi:MAG: ACP phosphodiesterase [Bacteroidia bacterium]|nr:ACP phosphodiesterase [Bacteroidia bacterium]
MHHLGHLFLAEETGEFQFGAFIADGVRAQRLALLPPGVRLGVEFHRWVDWQTDRHPAFLEARRLLRSAAGRYAGLMVDLWLDVVLGEQWPSLAIEPIETFEQRFREESLLPYQIWVPPSWRAFVERLCQERLLLHFASADFMLKHMEQFIQRRQLPLRPSSIQETIQNERAYLSEVLGSFWREALSWRRRTDTFKPNP